MSAKDKRKAGRPKGARDSKPRGRQKQLPTLTDSTGKELILNDKDKSVYTTIENFLSKENRKLFRELMPGQKSPVDSLKSLRDFLIARFKYYTLAEVEGKDEAKKIARLHLKELNEKGTIDGRKQNYGYIARKKLELIQIINSKGRMNTGLNTLAAEIRQYNELIDRIESGREDTTINIFNILKGKSDEETTKALTKELFRKTPDVDDIIDAEIIKEE